VVSPKDYLGDVMGDLASRRGRIQSQEDRGGTQIICRVHSKLEVTAPGSTLFADRCRPGAQQWARVRKNGAAHLEVAEAAE
jgi:translation elongation factor EF-G